MKEIGGYFGLEAHPGAPMYADLIALNSARNALVYVIKARQIKDILMPHLNCQVMADAMQKYCPETLIHFYHLDTHFIPIIEDFSLDFSIVYVNYYGFTESCLKKLKNRHVIFDNAQAFYLPPIPNGDTIYSPRKFFGVSDGGYLKTDIVLSESLKQDASWENALHLLKRVDCGAAAAYTDFQAAESALSGKPLMKMSSLTAQILSGIEHAVVIKKRRGNFAILHRILGNNNQLCSLIQSAFASESFVPLCYPYMVENAELLREKLIGNNIYIPIYWPELKESSEINAFECEFINKTVCLPIDQRYGETEMSQILKTVASNV